MKKFAFVVLLSTTTLYCHAIDGHNGIKFEMTQQQLESIGFICNPNTKKEREPIATCRHIDMTGIAFGVPTRNYAVEIDSDNRVSSIRVDIGINSMADYIELNTNISGFFPNNDEFETDSKQGSYIKNGWRANNNAGIWFTYFSGVKGIVKDKFWLIFNSPSYMTKRDNHRAEVKNNKTQ